MGRAAVNASRLPLIGIRDSGAGGLTVARQVRKALPGIPLLYFADTAHVPYGDRDPAEICHFAFCITQFLQEQGANLVIFACNTTSAYALHPAREHFDIPLLGMIEGGAEAALNAVSDCSSPRIGILATSATVNSHCYSQEIMTRCAAAQCFEIACPEFVPLVEADEVDSPRARQVCARAMAPLLEANVDAVILGCTHFPLLLPTLREVAPGTLFIDPAEGVARQTVRLIKSTFGAISSNSNGHADRYFASGSTEVLQHWIHKLMSPLTAPRIEPAPIFSLEADPVLT